MLIDFHTHVFPDRIAQRAIDVLVNGIIDVHGECVLAPKAAATLASLRASMEADGVTASVVMPIATTITQHRSINEFALAIADNKCIFSFGSVHPDQEDYTETLEKIAQKGFIGIKLHPEFQDFYVDDEKCVRIVKKAKSLGLRVMLHCGGDMGYRPPFHCTPQRLYNLAEKAGDENIIAAHLGGFDMWEDVLKYLAGTNMYMDTSMTNGYLAPDLCREIIEKHGADKILFGTDWPWQKAPGQLSYIMSLGLSSEDTEKIKYKNALRILSGKRPV